MKKLVGKVLHSLGYELRLKGTFDDLTVTEANFRNLCLNHEYFFREKFGPIPENDKRHKIMGDLLGTIPSESYFIVSALEQTKNVEGEVCEFGICQGATSLLIANEIQHRDKKKLHLLDSFQGLPAPTEKDLLKDDIFNLGSMEAYQGTMASTEGMVRDRLSTINFPEDRLVLHKGFVEDLIVEKKNFPKKVSFAYVDFDLYEPIKIILEHLDTVTDKGAKIVVDDYDWFSTGSKTAVDEFITATDGRWENFVPDTVAGHFCVLTRIR